MHSTMNNLPPPGGLLSSNIASVGSKEDVYNRLVTQLVDWFGTDHAVLDAVLQAYVTTGVLNYSQLVYDNLQMRLQTATEDNLDLIAEDYFGLNGLPRRPGESDDSYRNRISANLLQERATRRGMDNALYILTGYHPIIFEPWRPLDCGGYNVDNSPYTIGYGTHGAYGSGSYAYQCFINVFVSAYQGMASRSGYNSYYFGYNATGSPAIGWYGGSYLDSTVVSDQDIYQTINLTKVEGTICWVAIHRI